jgi:hypothetical protein
VIKVLDNIIDKELQDEIENLLFDPQCSWYYNPFTVTKEEEQEHADKHNLSKELLKNVVDTQMFVHSITKGTRIDDEKTGLVCAEILKQFQTRADFPIEIVYRIQSNLQIRDGHISEEQHNVIHVDNYDPHYVIIYYVNDTDGDTLFFNESSIIKRVSPKKGRILLFEGSNLHANQLPRKSLNRCVLNINIQKGIK